MIQFTYKLKLNERLNKMQSPTRIEATETRHWRVVQGGSRGPRHTGATRKQHSTLLRNAQHAKSRSRVRQGQTHATVSYSKNAGPTV